MTTTTADITPASIQETSSNPLRSYLVADLFCGAGGSSTGAQKAIESIGGTMNLVAVNHWPVAVETHSRNHPQARHYVQNLETADPETIVPERYLDLLMASPECRFFSRARGGKPTSEQGRMSPWIVQRWLTSINVRCLLVENVPEFTQWGPLLPNEKPDPKRRGMYFEEWIRSLWGLGYQAEWRMINAADHGDATSRTRFFLQARNDGLPIVWPEATHSRQASDTLEGRVKQWRGAREIIDWSNPGRSLLDDPKYLKKPLAVKTRRRIARGFQKYGGLLAYLYIRLLDLPEYTDEILEAQMNTPFIINRHGENGSLRCHPVHEPTPTVTARGAGYLVQAKAQPFTCANRNNCVPKDTGEPVPPLTTAHGGGIFLVEPDEAIQPQPFLLGQQSAATPKDTDEPVPTVASAGAISLTQPVILLYYKQSNCSPVHNPLPSITAKGRKHALVEPVIVEYYSQSDCSSIENPLPAVTTKDRHAICNPTLLQVNHAGQPASENSRAHSVDEPLPTVTSKRSVALANATLVQIDHGSQQDTDDRRAKSVDDPLPTIIAKNNLALAEPVIVQTAQTGGNGGYSRSTQEPLPTITTRNDINLVTPEGQPFIVPNFGERGSQQPRVHDIDEPAPAVTSRGGGNLVTPEASQSLLESALEAGIDPRRIVVINGQVYILDIRFRMLQNRELARAMGFDDEESQYEFTGNVSQITRQIGNAVPVNLAAALVRTALSEPQTAGAV